MPEYPADLPLTDLVRRLPSNVPFVGPESLERQRGRTFRVRAGANESSFGISPAVRAAMTAALDNVHCYNDPEGYELRCALAAKHGVDVAEIALGSGI
ncbi:MAG: pyridoxal phosphate-dependent aminotransferase, partial [Lentisphaeria bacterium]|nr:pyridoxal phosphate-dependent aminotransferase [Lentisphaeria bacterium]